MQPMHFRRPVNALAACPSSRRRKAPTLVPISSLQPVFRYRLQPRRYSVLSESHADDRASR